MAEGVAFAIEGLMGIITLKRTEALNALNMEMVLSLQSQIKIWANDPRIQGVMIRAEEGRAFCAGGDIRYLYNCTRQNHHEQMRFFKHEYQLNYNIRLFPKPYIALMDGITMGGGVGISLHGGYRVASERFRFSMPETGIGFFPDIGASHLLSRCPGNWGVYLALTGAQIQAHEAKAMGLIDYVVPSAQMNTLFEKLVHADLTRDAASQIKACVHALSGPEQPSQAAMNELVKQHFGGATVEAIMASLEKSSDSLAFDTLQTLQQKSPLSLKVTLKQIQLAKKMSLAACLKMDYRLAHHFMFDHDFYEGVRAFIIDKDKHPLWEPASLTAIPDSLVQSYFAPIDDPLEFVTF